MKDAVTQERFTNRSVVNYLSAHVSNALVSLNQDAQAELIEPSRAVEGLRQIPSESWVCHMTELIRLKIGDGTNVCAAKVNKGVYCCLAELFLDRWQGRFSAVQCRSRCNVTIESLNCRPQVDFSHFR